MRIYGQQMFFFVFLSQVLQGVSAALWLNLLYDFTSQTYFIFFVNI